MKNDFNDDWDIQQAYQDDPKKAFYLLSSHLFQPNKLGQLINTALDSQAQLQETIFNLANRARKQFWMEQICSKKGMLALLLFALVLAFAYRDPLAKFINTVIFK